MSGKLKIGIVAHNFCIRAMKESVALAAQGHELHLIHEKTPHLTNFFQSIRLYRDEKQLEQAIKDVNADIYHVHTEPTDLVTFVKNAVNKPVIGDYHDLNLSRTGENDEIEQKAFDLCNGAIFVSPPIQKHAVGSYNFGRESTVIHSMCPKGWFIDTHASDQHNGRIMYQGGAITPTQAMLSKVNFVYRDFTRLMYWVASVGVGLDMFVPKGIPEQYYTAIAFGINVRISPFIDYLSLLQVQQQYAWCFCMFDSDQRQIIDAAPNKVFDAICSGTPVLVNDGTYMAEFVKKWGIGVALPLDKEFSLPDDAVRKECKKRLLAVRNELCMEKEMEKIGEFYERVI